MKFRILIFCFCTLILPLNEMYGQNNYNGCYSYSNNSGFSEEICLNANGVFTYTYSREFIKIKAEGNWQIRNDKLILDSRPQKDKMIVYESRRKGKKPQVKVRKKSKEIMCYNLYVVYNEMDTLIFKQQWDFTEIPQGASSFYLVDTKGLYSPKYEIKGEATNYFEILFEPDRVFENEEWSFVTNGIIPNGLNNKPQEYTLLKKK